MKKLLLILFILPTTLFAQLTYIPDDNFEQELINLGYDNLLDNYVLTANINTISSLDLHNLNIYDLTGIEDFIALTYLDCANNELTNLDLSQNNNLIFLNVEKNQLHNLILNSNLEELFCFNNELTNLDLSQNINLLRINTWDNPLTSLDLSHNINLIHIDIGYDSITQIDLSNNLALEIIIIEYSPISNLVLSNQLALEQLVVRGTLVDSLDLTSNINLNFLACTDNLNISYLNINNVNLGAIGNNPNLYCINVIDPLNFLNFNTDPQNSFSINCNLEILGCTDTVACNYNPNATLNNGSCSYSTSEIINVNVCDSLSYFWGGSEYTTNGGPYVDSLINVNGCDSIVYLILTFNNSSSSYDTIISVDFEYYGEVIDIWGEEFLFGSGEYNYTDTLTNSAGCDSIVNTNLTIAFTDILELDNKNNRKLLFITDILGRETSKASKNQILFYIYDDGTVEKRFNLK